MVGPEGLASQRGWGLLGSRAPAIIIGGREASGRMKWGVRMHLRAIGGCENRKALIEQDAGWRMMDGPAPQK
jgi:hypothetical protein